jgi:hypothetical protein
LYYYYEYELNIIHFTSINKKKIRKVTPSVKEIMKGRREYEECNLGGS